MIAAFDPRDGTLTTDAGEPIGPSLSRAAFLASSLAVDAEPLIGNGPHASWRIARNLDGRLFRLGLYFEGDRLHTVVLALDDPSFGSSWADWTLEREMARKAAHDAWLASFDPAIEGSRAFGWGVVRSIHDDRSGGSEIVLAYDDRPAGPEPPGGQPIAVIE